jgi:transcription initiation factor IIF auxiliary subunit
LLLKAIQVIIEFGHKAFLKTKINSKGHTHDWNVYVRAGDNQSIEKLVNKVQFRLHETFKNPIRSKSNLFIF